jgi:ATP-dependent DNA helicase RecG
VTPVYRPKWPAALIQLREALTFLHHPTPDVALSTLEDHSHPAWQRLKAEELLAQQLSQLQSRANATCCVAPCWARQPAPGALPLHEQLMAVLPFALTAAQRRVGEEIAPTWPRRAHAPPAAGRCGLGQDRGVGPGRCLAMDAGWQCALMAPTEILAEQHFRQDDRLAGALLARAAARGLAGGRAKKKERTAMLALVASGEAALVVGTHAVIQDKVQFKNLALAIIDEQHRFGVAQRLALRGKKLATPPEGMEPHMLMMSATPIPRTLAMSYYADLDVSTIDELPPGRTPIVTKLIADSRKRRGD